MNHERLSLWCAAIPVAIILFALAVGALWNGIH